ncbi:MAG: hypothetical protein D6805_02120 [Planctomycetota bacterium]|nr:MAG: hypothetical protein D6805_02120 [Planctomycetota bacterium]
MDKRWKCCLLIFLFTCFFSPFLKGEEESVEDLKGDKELQSLLKEAEEESQKGSSSSTGKESSSESTASPGVIQKISQKLNEFNPRITIFGDISYHWSHKPVYNEEGEQISRRFSLREAEGDFRADVDPYAKGVLIVSLGEETPNQYTVDIEEGYITFESLPWNFRAKIGKFRPDIGILNKLHLHDVPQFNYPLPIQRFLGEEGLSTAGAALMWLFPYAPWDFSLQVLNVDQESAFPYPQRKNGKLSASSYPSIFFRNKLQESFLENYELQMGMTYGFGYGDKKNRLKNQIFGMDFFFRWRPLKRGTYRSFVIQTEFFYVERERFQQDGGNIYSIGLYSFIQYQINRNIYLGGRYDFSHDLEDSKNREYKLSGYVSYYTTEFLRLRLGYEYHHLNRQRPDIHSIFFQITFVFGSHPAEPYWVNR